VRAILNTDLLTQNADIIKHKVRLLDYH